MADPVRVSDIVASVFMPVHRAVKAGTHSEFWLRGGRGSTKSSFVSIEIILGMMRNPDANAIVYRKVAATLRESVYEQLVWAIDMLGVREFFQLRMTPMEITYKPTGQRILFRSCSRRNGRIPATWFPERACAWRRFFIDEHSDFRKIQEL